MSIDVTPVELGGGPSAVTIGNFDGVHLGHQEVFHAVKAEAARLGIRSVALTFRPHPQHALNPDGAPPLLLTYDEKVECIRAQGLDTVIEQAFGREFSTLTPEAFFKTHVLHDLRARSVVVGYDFAFGKDRKGSQEVMRRLCNEAGVALTVVPAFQLGGKTVSSTAIRALLSQGDIRGANASLGYAFYYRGRVIRGDRRGRDIGFPTANFEFPGEAKIALPLGVYVTETVLTGQAGQNVQQSIYRSVTNLGVRPTFKSQTPSAPLIETHVLDFNGDLYGRSLEVRFLERIREERKFSGLEELQNQIQKDIGVARTFPPEVSSSIK